MPNKSFIIVNLFDFCQKCYIRKSLKFFFFSMKYIYKEKKENLTCINISNILCWYVFLTIIKWCWCCHFFFLKWIYDMGGLLDERVVLETIFNNYDTDGKGNLSPIQMQILHGDLRMGGISLPQASKIV